MKNEEPLETALSLHIWGDYKNHRMRFSHALPENMSRYSPYLHDMRTHAPFAMCYALFAETPSNVCKLGNTRDAAYILYFESSAKRDA